mmetsp:Transcript_43013/g.77277  ORF Transcript_43013/g.77277 Transcript_43013/m.77277 type:complete len:214 (-) Transcript_43013:1696-2337(-)
MCRRGLRAKGSGLSRQPGPASRTRSRSRRVGALRTQSRGWSPGCMPRTRPRTERERTGLRARRWIKRRREQAAMGRIHLAPSPRDKLRPGRMAQRSRRPAPPPRPPMQTGPLTRAGLNPGVAAKRSPVHGGSGSTVAKRASGGGPAPARGERRHRWTPQKWTRWRGRRSFGAPRGLRTARCRCLCPSLWLSICGLACRRGWRPWIGSGPPTRR